MTTRTYTFQCVDGKNVITFEIDGHLCFDEFVEEIKKFSLAVGYHPETVEMYIPEEPVDNSDDDKYPINFATDDFPDGQASS